ncbi:TRAP transporter substrate-binding protein DctP [Lutimaribacter sp. EGI FJ00015]|uniref:TRAP transporter substrate-binding protein DctP n=1 Tax=Lutimaribacter degradans TaxID=2945989 RepID=A0ACC5ZSD4_9RHOB|nr:TRAP transporter substrate-binding protein DctP [Lutimaribacter sp. EGI FJ00013]MCM2560765.1 TRAP transporter substrate-binding protein DctP [Lutimaribacter sp. EGI FJ00013]MCO0612289.1 TRAP transporter substrate-binding protein DctP [Lutimaribacter sp. EGI FJ00015]MCO0634590.1 TRAP transporter substrate-binding protein DctP [Lutimaribacter sp. EGI FJ00014]
MKRRAFITAAAAAPAGLAAPNIVRAQAQHNWKLVTSVPRGLPGPGVSALRWAERITDITEGAINVEVFGAGELVAPFATQEAVEGGTAEVYHGSGSWFSGRDIAHSFFTAAPFGLTYDEMHAWMYFGGGQELLDEFTNPRGLKIFIGGGSGLQTAGWFKKEIKSLDDLQGLNFRAAGLYGEVLRKLGVNPTSIPPGDIFPALQAGTLDGAEWVGPSNDLAFGLQNVAGFMYAPSPVEIYGGIEFGIGMDAWNALTDAQRVMVEAVTEAEANRSSAYTLHAHLQAYEKLQNMPELTIDTFPDDVWDAIEVAAAEVIEEVKQTSDFHQRFVEAYYAYARQSTQYKRFYDSAFLTKRQSFFG